MKFIVKHKDGKYLKYDGLYYLIDNIDNATIYNYNNIVSHWERDGDIEIYEYVNGSGFDSNKKQRISIKDFERIVFSFIEVKRESLDPNIAQLEILQRKLQKI